MDRTASLDLVKTHLKTAYLLNDEKIMTMVPVLLGTLRTHIDQLAQLAANGETEQLGRASHAIKGALLNMGLADLAEIAATLEKHYKNGNTSIDNQALIMELQSTVAGMGEEG
jgi:HPt (histidine-containing phosphotransfer) domain-containing protein